jgi:hypothetical protein
VTNPSSRVAVYPDRRVSMPPENRRRDGGWAGFGDSLELLDLIPELIQVIGEVALEGLGAVLEFIGAGS